MMQADRVQLVAKKSASSQPFSEGEGHALLKIPENSFICLL